MDGFNPSNIQPQQFTSLTMDGFKNILLIGASGPVGPLIRRALEKDPDLNISILQRDIDQRPLFNLPIAVRRSKKSKKSKNNSAAPTPARLITVADSYPEEELVAAFAGQDVVINSTQSLDLGLQRRMVDAAIAAGVKRYVPGLFGPELLPPNPDEAEAPFYGRGNIHDYLREKSVEGAIEWMSASYGLRLSWSFSYSFLGIHMMGNRFVIWDEGDSGFSVVGDDTISAALIQALKSPETARNTHFCMSDVVCTQQELLEALQRIQGVEYHTSTVDSAMVIRESEVTAQYGDDYAKFALSETGIATGRGDLEKEGTVLIRQLGLEPKGLDELVTEGLKAYGAI